MQYAFDRAVPISALRRLFEQTSWAAHRSESDIRRMIAGSQVQLSVWNGEQLVAYSRVITDGRFRALIDDVIVDQAFRGAGIGGEMMERLIEQLEEVEEVILLTSELNVDFYRKYGFAPSSARCLTRARLPQDNRSTSRGSGN